MDDFDEDGIPQSPAGGQQFMTGGQQSEGARQFQQGGQQQFTTGGQQVQGHYQYSSDFGQQQSSGGHFAVGGQQASAGQSLSSHAFEQQFMEIDDQESLNAARSPPVQQFSTSSFGQHPSASVAGFPSGHQPPQNSFYQQQPSAQPQYYHGPSAGGQQQSFSQPAPHFQLGVQQPYASGMSNTGGPQLQQLSPLAPQFQPGVQQHITSGQSSPVGTQFPGNQYFSQGQQNQGTQHFNAVGQQFQHMPSGFQPHPQPQPQGTQQYSAPRQFIGVQQPFAGQQLAGFQPFGQQVQMGPQELQAYTEDSDGEDGYDGDDESAIEYESESEGQDEDDDQEMAEGMIEDPLYQQTLDMVNKWRQESDTSLNEQQKAQLAAHSAWKQQGQGKKRLADEGDCDFEEDEMDDAVRAAKRQRVVEPESHHFHRDAQKVYAYGPSNNPDLVAGKDDDNDELDGLALDAEILGLSAGFKGQFSGETFNLADGLLKPPPAHSIFGPGFRLIESICSSFWLMIEVTKHFSVNQIIKLYAVSRTFHDTVNARFQSTIAAWAQHMSPAGWKVFYWKFYGKYTIKDPVGKTWFNPGPVTIPRPPWAAPPRAISMQHQVRRVPGFKYLAMLDERERRTRDILACLARAGHRLPRTMHITLKKIWMLMDMATNNLRRAFIHHQELWTDRDLYNAQMFFVKLNMRFNEPIFGPDTTILADTFLGAREGLTELWKLLRKKAYHHPNEVVRRRIKYWVPEEFSDHYQLIGRSYFGVMPYDLGQEHKEGWGSGLIHLMRPDELVVEECVRREIDMQQHLVFMVFWGHVDWKRRTNLVPTEDEMYMSDKELPLLPKTGKFNRFGIHGRCGNVPFEYEDWQPKHAMKARWKTLTRDEKRAIVKDDNDEQLRAMEFEEADDEFWNPDNVNDEFCSEGKEDEDAEPEAEVEPEESQDQQMDDDNGDAASVEPWFRNQPRDPDADDVCLVTYPLWPEEDSEADVIEKQEYEYQDGRPLSIPETIMDRKTIAGWDDLDPYLQQKIIDEEDRLERQDLKDTRTIAIIVTEELEKLDRQPEAVKQATLAQMHAQWQQQGNGQSSTSAQQQQQQQQAAQPSTSSTTGSQQQQQQQQQGDDLPETAPDPDRPAYLYKYPTITDPVLLSLLRKYDCFAPEDFRCDENGNPLSCDDGDDNDDENDENAMNDDAQDETVAPGGSDSKPVSESESESESDFMDDDALKALADVEYAEEELDFDVERYQKFLARVGDDGGFKDPEKGILKKDVKGKGKARAATDESEEDFEMAHEKDLDAGDDDIQFPEYEFRKY